MWGAAMNSKLAWKKAHGKLKSRKSPYVRCNYQPIPTDLLATAKSCGSERSFSLLLCDFLHWYCGFCAE